MTPIARLARIVAIAYQTNVDRTHTARPVATRLTREGTPVAAMMRITNATIRRMYAIVIGGTSKQPELHGRPRQSQLTRAFVLALVDVGGAAFGTFQKPDPASQIRFVSLVMSGDRVEVRRATSADFRARHLKSAPFPEAN